MHIVTKTEDLSHQIDNIRKKDEFVTIDTEFVREKTYYPDIGLIQIGHSEGEFVVDPLSEEINLNILGDLLFDNKITKVFHACQQDIEIIRNIFGEIPQNVFDTQVACKLLGFGEAISYGKLVERFCDTSVDKSTRFTDWTRRPLTDAQVAYALDDVIYLKTIYFRIRESLDKRQRTSWALEEMQKLLDEELYRTHPEDAWKKLKYKSTEPVYLSILRELAKWREIRASQVNRPRSWILKDEAIQEIAYRKPKAPGDLRDMRFFKYDEKSAVELVNCVELGLRDKNPPIPDKNTSISDNILPVVTLLKILLRNQSIENDVAPSVIADIEDLKDIAQGDIRNSKVMKGWRHEIFGSFAKKLVEGKVGLSAKGRNVFIIDLESHFV